MGSSSIDSCSHNGVIGEQLYDDSRSKRPDFYPCDVCGRKFTMRAMVVHKRSCLETEGCQCSVCKSGSKKFKWENMERRTETSLDNYSDNDVSVKTQNAVHVKSHIQSTMRGRLYAVENSSVTENNVITFKFVENHIIDKMVGCDNSVKSIEDSAVKFNESAVFNDHKYVSSSPQLPKNSSTVNNRSQGSRGRTPNFIQLSDKPDHECTRKIFCTVCNEHIFWEIFGLHFIEHCEILENNQLKCPGCDRVFDKPTYAHVLTHFVVHILNHPENCSSCRCADSKCIDARNRAVAEHCYADKLLFYCYICLTRFSHNQTVANHMRLHTNEMPFKCTECKRSFRQIGNLQRHMTTHRGDKPHKCVNCFRSFADPATLRNHIRIHTRETPFVCTICKRGFTQVGNLKRHMALHLPKDVPSTTFSSTIEMISDENTMSIGDSPNDDKFNSNSLPESVEKDHDNNHSTSDIAVNNNVESPGHINNIIGRNRKKKKNRRMRVFNCKCCGKLYTWRHDLRVHYRSHTGEKPFKCDICGRGFSQSGAVRTHKVRHHRGRRLLNKQKSS